MALIIGLLNSFVCSNIRVSWEHTHIEPSETEHNQEVWVADLKFQTLQTNGVMDKANEQTVASPGALFCQVRQR
jgi:hypothetical protein